MTRRIYGDDGDNLISGDGRIDRIYGEGGNDTLNGQAGDDELRGQAGDDRLDGGDGNDLLYAGMGPGVARAGHDTLIGGEGADRLYAGAFDQADGGAGDDFLDGVGGGTGTFAGGDGHDILEFRFTSDAAYHGDLAYLMDLKAGDTVTLDGVTVSGFEGGGVTLGTGDDEVKLARTLKGWTVSGGAGVDTITGTAGADHSLKGGDGDDTVRGLGGDDVLRDDFQQGRHDRDLIDGGAGNDSLIGGYSDVTLDGGSGADTLQAAGFSNTLLGGGGADLLIAADTFYAASLLDGGDGGDTLHGSFFNDTLEGGAGHDVYLYGDVRDSGPSYGIDTIQDADGDLVVDLSGIDTIKTSGSRADDPFRLVDAFDGGAAELTIRYDASDGMTHVEGDVNKDMQADLVILIDGDHTDLSQYVL